MPGKAGLRAPLISVVISAFCLERFSATVGCVHSVLGNTYRDHEIILVIDGNRELKQRMEQEFKECDRVLIVGGERDEGPSAARNRGVGFARGEIVAFIDDDAFAPVDWLGNIARNFSEYPGILAVGGKLLPVYENGWSRLPEEILWIAGCTYKGHPEKRQFVRNVISANMAVKKDVFKEIHFETMSDRKDRALFFPIKQLEDTLFGIRLNNKKQGTVLYDPDTVVHHRVPAERLKLGYILKRTFSEGIMKAKLGRISSTTLSQKKILSHEQDYLGVLLGSTIKNFYTLRLRDSLLLSLTALSVASGYISERILNMNTGRTPYGNPEIPDDN